MSNKDIFYTDETKIKELTVGQLKDILSEMFIKYNNTNQFVNSATQIYTRKVQYNSGDIIC